MKLHRVPKLAAPLFQTRLIQLVVHGFQWNIVHCTILTLVMVIPMLTYAPYRVLSVTSLCRRSLFTLWYVQCIVIDKGINQQCIRLRLRACVEAKGGHFKLKLVFKSLKTSSEW